MDKKKLLVSFSGGETSGFMSYWLWTHMQDEFEMKFVFANTGQENEQTLDFVRKCSDYFGFPVTWIESKVYKDERKSSSFKIVNFFIASRLGEPFEAIISKYGIPNVNSPHCTRELKQNPINSFAKYLGWEKYYTAIGIRIDEIDRMNFKRKEKMIIYPLINKEMQPMSKKMINFWWGLQPFRLELKGYQGNCITCWKKSDRKLFQIAKENQNAFEFNKKMENMYGNFISDSKKIAMAKKGKIAPERINFFRNDRNSDDIINQSRLFEKEVIDDSVNDEMENESCEVFSQCGIDN